MHSIEKLGWYSFSSIYIAVNNIKNILLNIIDGLIITGGNFDIDPKLIWKPKLEGSQEMLKSLIVLILKLKIAIRV